MLNTTSYMYARLVKGTNDELDSLYNLALNAGVGMTSIPADKHLLEHKVLNSLRSARGEIERGKESFMFVLCYVDMDGEKIVGVSTITNISEDYYSFKLVGRPQVMVLTKEYKDTTMVGGLYISPSFRHYGSAKLISKARYMYMAQFPQFFNSTVISEIRGGWNNDHSPFYGHIMEKFLKMSFDEVNKKVTTEGRNSINEKLPKHPIYVDLLSYTAKCSLKAIHYKSSSAHWMLIQEGFKCDDVLDLIDGGPVMNCQRENIKTVENSFITSKKVDALEDKKFYIVANTSKENFKVVYKPIINFKPKTNYLGLDELSLKILEVKRGDKVQFSNTKDTES